MTILPFEGFGIQWKNTREDLFGNGRLYAHPTFVDWGLHRSSRALPLCAPRYVVQRGTDVEAGSGCLVLPHGRPIDKSNRVQVSNKPDLSA